MHPNVSAETYPPKANRWAPLNEYLLDYDRQEGGRIKEEEKEVRRLCYYIDEWNLHADCKLKLERVVQDESQEHRYRLKPTKVYEKQVFNAFFGLPEVA